MQKGIVEFKIVKRMGLNGVFCDRKTIYTSSLILFLLDYVSDLHHTNMVTILIFCGIHTCVFVDMIQINQL